MEDLVLSCLESRVEEARNLYARFLVGPFLKGDALTVATALRRVLLSSIESIGITALYIQGITHEFSTIVGVRESVLELSLNFQAVVLSYDKTFFQKKLFFDDLQIGYLQVQGPKVIYANDLKLPLGVRLVDPTQYIATVSKEGSIVLKFIIGKKRAFLHQNTGPESFFGNPARDLPITGKVSKKNIVRAKKTCLYKKGSTIDWLPLQSFVSPYKSQICKGSEEVSGKNVLQPQNIAFAPPLVTKQRRSFTNTRFSYKSLRRMQNETNSLVKRSFALVAKRVALAEMKSSLFSLRSPKRQCTYMHRNAPLQIGDLMPRALTKQSFVCPYKSSYKYKSTICKKLCTCKEASSAKQSFAKRFVRAYKSKICTGKVQSKTKRRFSLLSPSVPSPLAGWARKRSYGLASLCTCKGTQSKTAKEALFFRAKNDFALRFLTKQKNFFKNFCSKKSNIFSQLKFYPNISPLLKNDMALFLKKKNRAIKENDVREKKSLFLKSNDNVFKSDICLRNVIPLDFTLTPVLKVNFVVEIDDEVLYLRQKVRERIILEVWTNGSIHPRQAVHDAALSLTDIFASFRSVYGATS